MTKQTNQSREGECPCGKTADTSIRLDGTCMACGKSIFTTPTHSPTETVHLQITNPAINTYLKETIGKQLTNEKTTINTEPTVEKWEDSKIDYSQSFTLGLNKDNTEMITITPQSSETMQASMSFRQLHRILSQVRSHSVQEAKAGLIQEIELYFLSRPIGDKRLDIRDSLLAILKGET